VPNLSATVCIPWIETGGPWRSKAREWILRYYSDLAFVVSPEMAADGPVNRSAARNAAAAMADTPVLFFADADTWVPPEQFRDAVLAARESGNLVHAYTLHTRLSKKATTLTLEGKTSHEGATVRNAPAGAIAVSRELFDSVGGWDERFEGWGYEDRCFQFACDTIAGAGQRIAGRSYHLWHPRGKDQIQTQPERRRGAVLAQRYKSASGVKVRTGIVGATKNAERNREAMLAVLSEPGGPLDPARLSVPL
jgi:glycosyltransferase involved in cell wall biosynthesis